MKEQRRFPRLNLAIRIEYAILDRPLEVRKAQVINISTAGLSIKTGELLENGVYLDIKFYLPKDRNPIEAISRVAWSKEAARNNFESGIEFVKINYADQLRIAELITEE